MLFKQHDILTYLQGNLHDEAWAAHVLMQLGSDPEIAKLRLAWLRTLPDYIQTRKIGDRLVVLASRRGYQIRDVYWWDMSMDDSYHVLAVLSRSGSDILMHFSWKIAESPKDTHTQKATAFCGWGRDRGASGGWRFELEAAGWKGLKKAFKQWLRQPLPSFPAQEAANDTTPVLPRALALPILPKAAAE